MKSDINPMDRLAAARAAPRCHATSKRSGERCKSPAVAGWKVCRFHGAHGGAPKGKANGRYRHGLRTQEAVEMRGQVRQIVKLSRDLLLKL